MMHKKVTGADFIKALRELNHYSKELAEQVEDLLYRRLAIARMDDDELGEHLDGIEISVRSISYLYDRLRVVQEEME
jgi:predicted KAP-like P-loop ATPase